MPGSVGERLCIAWNDRLIDHRMQVGAALNDCCVGQGLSTCLHQPEEKGVCLLQLPPVVLKRAVVFLGSIFWFCSSHTMGPISGHWVMNSFVKCIKDGASDL